MLPFSRVGRYSQRVLPAAAVFALTVCCAQAAVAADGRFTVSVVINVPGRSVAEVSQSVLPLAEQAFQKLEGVERVRSLAVSGRGVVWTEFTEKMEVAAAHQLVVKGLAALNEQLDAKIALWPATSQRSGVVLIGLWSQELSADVSARVAEVHLRPRLTTIAGVAGVRILGGATEQCRIDVDGERLKKFKLDVPSLVTALKESGFLIRGGGTIPEPPNGDVPPLANSLEQLGDLVVSTGDGTPVRLRDVAQVSLGGDRGGGPASLFEAKSDAASRKSALGVVLTVRILPGWDQAEILRAIDGVRSDVAQSFPAGVEMSRRVFEPDEDAVFLQLPDGAGVDRKIQAAERAEAVLKEMPDLTALWRLPQERSSAWASAVSTGPDIELLPAYGNESTPAQRSRRREEILRRFAAEPGCLATIGPARLGKWDDPLDVEVAIALTGSDPAMLHDLAAKFSERSGKIPGVTPVQRAGLRVEQQLELDRKKLAELGIHEKACRDSLHAAFHGFTVGTFHAQGPPVEVVIRVGGDKPDPESLRRLKISDKRGEQVPLIDVVKQSQNASPAYLYRENGRPTAVIGCGFDRVVTDADIELLKQAARGIEWPAGYSWRIVRRGE